jgi:lactoylglutathione lyase
MARSPTARPRAAAWAKAGLPVTAAPGHAKLPAAPPLEAPTRQQEERPLRYLHTMLRVRNIDDALDFYCNKLGLKEVRRRVDDKNRYTLVFLAGPEDESLVADSKRAKGRDAPLVELTYNWDSEDYGEARYFGHLAYEVDDIYATCDKLMKAGVTINRPPRDGNMAFVRSPDKHSIELLQKGDPLPPKEPWKSMANSGKW